MRKVFLMLCVVVAALVMTNLALATPLVITDLETGNPWQTWGTGSWQNRTQQVVTNYSASDPTMTGNWLEVGVGGWGMGMTIIPGWASGVWDTWNPTTYNAHSNIEFDAVLFTGDDNMSWPSNTLTVNFNRDGDGNSQTPSGLTVTFDVTNLKDQVAHFVIPYSTMDTVALPDHATDGGFQGYLSYFTHTTDGTIYLDNWQFTGDPLPSPEPATIVMLVLAGLMGLLYSRKR
jgi:hypothetical protein